MLNICGPYIKQVIEPIDDNAFEIIGVNWILFVTIRMFINIDVNKH